VLAGIFAVSQGSMHTHCRNPTKKVTSTINTTEYEDSVLAGIAERGYFCVVDDNGPALIVRDTTVGGLCESLSDQGVIFLPAPATQDVITTPARNSLPDFNQESKQAAAVSEAELFSLSCHGGKASHDARAEDPFAPWCPSTRMGLLAAAGWHKLPQSGECGSIAKLQAITELILK
jgi:hypothetical protein